MGFVRSPNTPSTSSKFRHPKLHKNQKLNTLDAPKLNM